MRLITRCVDSKWKCGRPRVNSSTLFGVDNISPSGDHHNGWNQESGCRSRTMRSSFTGHCLQAADNCTVGEPTGVKKVDGLWKLTDPYPPLLYREEERTYYLERQRYHGNSCNRSKSNALTVNRYSSSSDYPPTEPRILGFRKLDFVRQASR